jgi:hypothetical protein
MLQAKKLNGQLANNEKAHHRPKVSGNISNPFKLVPREKRKDEAVSTPNRLQINKVNSQGNIPSKEMLN